MVILGIIIIIIIIIILWSACAAGPRNTPMDDAEQIRCIKDFYKKKGKNYE